MISEEDSTSLGQDQVLLRLICSVLRDSVGIETTEDNVEESLF